MKTKKILALLLVVSMVAVLLAACAEESGGEALTRDPEDSSSVDAVSYTHLLTWERRTGTNLLVHCPI